MSSLDIDERVREGIAAWALAVPGMAPNGVSALTVNSLSGDAATIAASAKVRLMPGTIAVS
jgi:hypothetical protein